MKSNILKQLKDKYADLGLSVETLDSVAEQLAVYTEKEEQVATVVAGAEGMLKSFQSYVDSRVGAFKSESKQRAEEIEQLKKQLSEIGNQHPPTSDKGGGDDVLKQLEDKLAVLTDSIDKLSGERTQERMVKEFADKIGDSVPTSFYTLMLNGRELKDTKQVEELVEVVKSGYEGYKQDMANLGFDLSKSPEVGKGGSEQGEEIARMIREGTEDFLKEKGNG